MTSSNRNIFPRYWPLCGEFTGHRWIPPTKASGAELWCFLWSATWINGWVNNHEAGDLRRHCAYYGITVTGVNKHKSSYFINRQIISSTRYDISYLINHHTDIRRLWGTNLLGNRRSLTCAITQRTTGDISAWPDDSSAWHDITEWMQWQDLVLFSEKNRSSDHLFHPTPTFTMQSLKYKLRWPNLLIGCIRCLHVIWLLCREIRHWRRGQLTSEHFVFNKYVHVITQKTTRM